VYRQNKKFKLLKLLGRKTKGSGLVFTTIVFYEDMRNNESHIFS